MKLYGILLVQNEGDILEQTLLNLLSIKAFDKIFLFDMGSSDDTLAIAEKHANDVLTVNQCNEKFSDQLRFDLLYKQVNFEQGDWLAIIDADEHYIDSPYEMIKKAETEGANYIEASSIQFYFTEKDLNIPYIREEAIEDCRKHYLINWSETRLLKHIEGYTHNDIDKKAKNKPLIKATENILLKHFQYRSPEQIQKRIDTRIKNHSHSGNWGHVKHSDWQEYIIPSNYLHEFDGTFHYGLPSKVNLFTVKNNPAYTQHSLRWMKNNNTLEVKHERWFNETGLSRYFFKLLALLKRN